MIVQSTRSRNYDFCTIFLPYCGENPKERQIVGSLPRQRTAIYSFTFPTVFSETQHPWDATTTLWSRRAHRWPFLISQIQKDTQGTLLTIKWNKGETANRGKAAPWDSSRLCFSNCIISQGNDSKGNRINIENQINTFQNLNSRYACLYAFSSWITNTCIYISEKIFPSHLIRYRFSLKGKDP